MNQPISLITPTHAGDLDRFCLQRRSIARCGIDIPHVAIVNHEDLPLFRDQSLGTNLQLVSTRDVLPTSLERRRMACKTPRRNPRRWIAGKPMHGWIVQQFIKLSAPAFVASDIIVCLDSDTLFLERVTTEDFTDPVTGKPLLYETFDDVDAEMAEWVGRSMRFLGVKPTHQPVSRFTHSPVVMSRPVLLDMQRFIEARYKRGWIDATDRFGMIMEYSTYGVFAKYVDNLARVSPSTPALSTYYWWSEEVARLVDTLPQRLRGTSTKMLAIQSNAGLPVDAYKDILEQVWNDRAAVQV
jgi:hypothetical protein